MEGRKGPRESSSPNRLVYRISLLSLQCEGLGEQVGSNFEVAVNHQAKSSSKGSEVVIGAKEEGSTEGRAVLRVIECYAGPVLIAWDPATLRYTPRSAVSVNEIVSLNSALEGGMRSDTPIQFSVHKDVSPYSVWSTVHLKGCTFCH